MLNTKSFVRNAKQDRLEDLSILTGRVERESKKNERPRRVKVGDKLLKTHFISARVNAMNVLADNSAITSDETTSTDSSAYFNNIENPDTENVQPSLFDLQQSVTSPITPNLKIGSSLPSEIPMTISSAPILIKSTFISTSGSSKKHAFKPLSENRANICKQSETQYWSAFSETLKRKPKKSSRTSATVFKMDSVCPQTTGKGKSSWNVCSSYPITRCDASLVHHEIFTDPALSGRSTSCGSTPANEYNSNNPYVNGRLVPSLLQAVKLPPSSTSNNQGNFLASESEKGSKKPDYAGVVQGEWISREQLGGDARITKKYSIAQIMDILCGYL